MAAAVRAGPQRGGAGVEPVWSRTKYTDLANFVPEDVEDLATEAELSLEDTQGDQQLLRSFFAAAGLSLD